MRPIRIKHLVDDIREIVRIYRAQAASMLNQTIIHERWDIGKRIVEEEQNGNLRAEYGTKLLKIISEELTLELGKGYSPRALSYYRQLYIYFPNYEILQTRLQNLTWSHIQAILGEKNEAARLWYINEAAQQTWSVKTLERNIGSQYYHSLLSSSDKSSVEEEMKQLTSSKEFIPISAEHYIKSPVVTEFLGLPNDCSYTESDLENVSIIDIKG